MRVLVYGDDWSAYPEIHMPKGFISHEVRDKTVLGGMRRAMSVGFTGADIAAVFSISNPDVQHLWPLWFYELHEIVQKEMR